MYFEFLGQQQNYLVHSVHFHPIIFYVCKKQHEKSLVKQNSTQ